MSHQTLWTRPAQSLPAPCPQPNAKTISINSESCAGHFKRKWPLGAAIRDPRLDLGVCPTLNRGTAVGTSLKTPQSVHQNSQHQLLDAVIAWVLRACACVPLDRHQNARGYQFNDGALYWHSTAPFADEPPFFGALYKQVR